MGLYTFDGSAVARACGAKLSICTLYSLGAVFPVGVQHTRPRRNVGLSGNAFGTER